MDHTLSVATMGDDRAAMLIDAAEDSSSLFGLSQEMSRLAMSDREILDPPKDAIVLYDFAGESSYGELNLRAGDRVRILCEDMTGGWSLAMNVLEKQPLYAVLDASDQAVNLEHANRITKGLLPQGFYKYTFIYGHLSSSPATVAELGPIGPQVILSADKTSADRGEASSGQVTPSYPSIAAGSAKKTR